MAEQLVEAAAEQLDGGDFPYLFSLSASTTTQMVSLRTGFRSAGSPEVANRRTTKRLVSDRLRRWLLRLPLVWRLANGGSGAAHFRDLDRDSPLERRNMSGQVSVQREPRPGAMADLVARIGTDGRIRQVRDEAYFAWRFRDPLSVYRFVFWADLRLEGYLVLQAPARRPARLVNIVDWEASDARVREELLRAALRWGGFDALATWSRSLPADARALLQRNGFRLADPPASLGRAYRLDIARPRVLERGVGSEALRQDDWALAGRRLLDLDDWDLRMIYSDGY
jgi:hypothetical protein